MNNYYCGCSNRLVKPRCTPVTVDETLLSTDTNAILVDDFDTALLIGLTRGGSGVEFEYNRQETT